MSSKEENLNVPVIDIRPLVISESKPGDVAKTIESIGSACKEWGFFYILGHQVQPKFIEDVQRLSRAFFQRPKEFKDRVARTSVGFKFSKLRHKSLLFLSWEWIFLVDKLPRLFRFWTYKASVGLEGNIWFWFWVDRKRRAETGRWRK